jgi:HK97 gp10 family phage protein
MVKANVDDRRLNRKFRRMPRAMTAPTRKAIRKGALQVRRTATTSIRNPGKGRLYTHRFFTDKSGVVRPLTGKKGQRPPHRASAPGDPPASDTGRLLGSIEVVMRDGGLAAEIGTALDYGRFLEFGTKNVEARPWLQPAWEKHRKQIIRDVANEINKALRRDTRIFS